MAPFIHPEDARQLAALLSTPEWKDITVTVDYRARHKNGSYVWIETTARPFIDEPGGRREFQAS